MVPACLCMSTHVCACMCSGVWRHAWWWSGGWPGCGIPELTTSEGLFLDNHVLHGESMCDVYVCVKVSVYVGGGGILVYSVHHMAGWV